MVHKLVVLEWLYKADQDFGFASLALSEEQLSYYDPICFHFHQAAEKYLKAYIVKYDLPFRKEHDLRKLATTCSKHHSAFSALIPACTYLNSFYIETRYADDRFVTFTREDALEAQKSAQTIQETVRSELGIHYEITIDIVQEENKKVDEQLQKD